jgi:hypothetical protein
MTLWQRIRPWVEDLFAAACWLAMMLGGSLWLIAVGP